MDQKSLAAAQVQLSGRNVNIDKFRADDGMRRGRSVLAVAFRRRSPCRHRSLEKEGSLEKEAETPAIVTSRVVVITLAWGLVEYMIATLAGAAIYTEA